MPVEMNDKAQKYKKYLLDSTAYHVLQVLCKAAVGG